MNKQQPLRQASVCRITGWIALAISMAVLGQAESPTAAPAPPQADPNYMRALIEMARPEVRERKAATILQSMELNESESAAFRTVQADYDKEQGKLFDERVALIEEYAKQYESMTDKQARELIQKSFDLEARRTALKRKFWPRFEKAVSARKTARFFQLDNQVSMAIDLSILGRLPLIK